MTRAVIVGSGVGGVVAAHALKLAGIETVVLERAPDVRTLYVGTGIHVWHNAMRALQLLGLDERVKAVSGPLALVDEMIFLSRNGRRFGAVDCGEIGRRMGADCYGVSRADLLPALAGALDEGTIRTGCRVAAVEQVGDGVRAVLEDGSEERGDVLIGADGADSTIRGTLGSSPPPRYPGYTVFLGTAEDPDGSAAPMNKFPMRFGPGRRFATYRIGGDRFCWLAVVNAEEGGQETPERQKAVLLDRFRGWAGPVERIIEMTDEKRVYRRDPHYLEPGAPWGLGRVTLLGDAAHAMTFDMGQGAAQSIEDAYVIGDCLGGSDPVAGLRRYEERRARRAGQMVTLSRRFGRVAAWQSPQLTALRAMLFTLALRTKLIFTVQARDLAYQFERSAG